MRALSRPARLDGFLRHTIRIIKYLISSLYRYQIKEKRNKEKKEWPETTTLLYVIQMHNGKHHLLSPTITYELAAEQEPKSGDCTVSRKITRQKQ